MATENRIEEIIRTSLEKMRTMLDANTVIGTPITTANGVTIIPISKISMGIASGGLDYLANKPQKTESEEKNPFRGFGGGGGSGLTVNPVGFLVVSADGKVEMINVGLQPPADPFEQVADFIERSPEIIASIKDVFRKKSDAEKAAEE